MSNMTPSGGINTDLIREAERKIKYGLVPTASISAINKTQDIVPDLMRKTHRHMIIPIAVNLVIIIGCLLLIIISRPGALGTAFLILSSALSALGVVFLTFVWWEMLARLTTTIHTMTSLSMTEKKVVEQLSRIAATKNVDVSDLDDTADKSFREYMQKLEKMIEEPTKHSADEITEHQSTFNDQINDIQSLMILRQMQYEYRDDDTGAGAAIEKMIIQGMSDDDIQSQVYMTSGLDIDVNTINSIRALLVRLDVLSDIFSFWSDDTDIVSWKDQDTEEKNNERDT